MKSPPQCRSVPEAPPGPDSPPGTWASVLRFGLTCPGDSGPPWAALLRSVPGPSPPPPPTRPVPFTSGRSRCISKSSVPQTLWAYLSSAIWTPYLILKHVPVMTASCSQLIYGLRGPSFIRYHASPFDLSYPPCASAAPGINLPPSPGCPAAHGRESRLPVPSTKLTFVSKTSIRCECSLVRGFVLIYFVPLILEFSSCFSFISFRPWSLAIAGYGVSITSCPGGSWEGRAGRRGAVGSDKGAGQARGALVSSAALAKLTSHPQHLFCLENGNISEHLTM